MNKINILKNLYILKQLSTTNNVNSYNEELMKLNRSDVILIDIYFLGSTDAKFSNFTYDFELDIIENRMSKSYTYKTNDVSIVNVNDRLGKIQSLSNQGLSDLLDLMYLDINNQKGVFNSGFLKQGFINDLALFTFHPNFSKNLLKKIEKIFNDFIDRDNTRTDKLTMNDIIIFEEKQSYHEKAIDIFEESILKYDYQQIFDRLLKICSNVPDRFKKVQKINDFIKEIIIEHNQPFNKSFLSKDSIFLDYTKLSDVNKILYDILNKKIKEINIDTLRFLLNNDSEDNKDILNCIEIKKDIISLLGDEDLIKLLHIIENKEIQSFIENKFENNKDNLQDFEF